MYWISYHRIIKLLINFGDSTESFKIKSVISKLFKYKPYTIVEINNNKKIQTTNLFCFNVIICPKKFLIFNVFQYIISC